MSFFSKSNDSQKLLSLLAMASSELGSSLDYIETTEHICSLPVPSLADWSSLFILDEKDSKLLFVRSHHCNSNSKKSLIDYFENNSDEYIKRFVVTDALKQGRAITEIREVPSPIAGFLLNLPLIRRAEVIGFLTLGSGKVFTPQDILIAEELAQRAGIAIDNARLYQRACLAEIELKKCIQLAEQANKVKGEFFANMSHEIRSPVAAILGFVDLLLQPDQPEDERIKWGYRVKYNGHNLLRLINDILNLSKIESGEFVLERDVVNLSLFLNDLEAIYTEQVKLKGLVFQVRLVTCVPSEFKTDVTRMYQILTNVIGNAIKLTTKGGVHVDIGFIEELGLLYFDVEDTGPGLTEAQASLLFRPFVKVNAEHSKLEGSTGLGLALALKLARLLGGSVELRSSQPGKGSRFRISIKPELCPQVEFIKRFKNQAVPTDKPARQDEISLKGKKILVVDDSADNQYLIKLLLTNKGALVTVAESGDEAINCVQNYDFNLILMDIQMPDKDGYETTRELRKNGCKKPIVALTAHTACEEQEQSLGCEFNEYLIKPINQDKLMRVLIDLLGI